MPWWGWAIFLWLLFNGSIILAAALWTAPEDLEHDGELVYLDDRRPV